MSAAAPCRCGCAQASVVHAIVAALADDDVDGALALGLLDSQSCAGCTPECTTMLIAARDARRDALAARARYRARNARLAQRAQERAAQRTGARPAIEAVEQGNAVPTTRPALPSAAAAALARAKAKAAERSKP